MYEKVSYEKFLETVKNNILDYLPDSYQQAEVVIDKVTKTNTTLDALKIIVSENQKITPALYLNNFYENGKDLDDTLVEIANAYSDALANAPDVNIKDANNPKNIVLALINRESNKDLLKKVPHRNFEDLAIIYKIIVGSDENGICSAVIKNEHAAALNLTEEDLFNFAYENTKRILPVKVKGITQVIKEIMLGIEIEDEIDEDEGQYVITNKNKVFGAAYMIYVDEVISDLAKKLDSDLYILPSSIHEIIVIPAERSEKNDKDFKKMVQEVNDEGVAKNEILSYSVYFYDRNDGAVRKVE